MSQKPATPKDHKTAITPTRAEDYPEWYLQVIKAADLAENSPVRGCMVIKPWGYGLWESIQGVLDRRFKETGHSNAYFPLLIPLSFMQKEAEHVEGFAKECAVVTHHRLETKDGVLVPAGPLEEPMIIRPTSEMIIGAMYAKWVQSYRDLPILINQWANVFRWEMRTRLFLRTAEFLWQEGHTCHATAAEAEEETLKMLDVYGDFAENYLAIPVIKGEKPVHERFPGAVNTYAIEAMMQDRKALQAGTSHFLGQNFAKAAGIQFLDAEGQQQTAWTTSWGVSTRLIGGLIMTHADDDGLVIPPKIAQTHGVICPIYRNEDERRLVLDYCKSLQKELNTQFFGDGRINITIDDRDIRGGEKSWNWIKKGVPLRLEIGPRDVASQAVFLGRRDRSPKDKISLGRDAMVATCSTILGEIQQGLFDKAAKHLKENTVTIDNLADFVEYFTPKNPTKPEIHGGFALSHFNPTPEVLERLKELKVTTRCIPLDGPEETGKCIFSGQPSTKRMLFAKAY